MFERYPEDFSTFAEVFALPGCKPNAAHRYLARLEETGKLQAVVTQNIDSLHEMVGSKRVLKLHGSADRNYCTGWPAILWFGGLLALEGLVPHCLNCGKVVEKAWCDSLRGTLSIWTSLAKQSKPSKRLISWLSVEPLVVYPAASLIQYFRGKKLVVINKTSIPLRQTSRPGLSKEKSAKSFSIKTIKISEEHGSLRYFITYQTSLPQASIRWISLPFLRGLFFIVWCKSARSGLRYQGNETMLFPLRIAVEDPGRNGSHPDQSKRLKRVPGHWRRWISYDALWERISSREVREGFLRSP